jgi:hypothetical protein
MKERVETEMVKGERSEGKREKMLNMKSKLLRGKIKQKNERPRRTHMARLELYDLTLSSGKLILLSAATRIQ